LPVDLVDRQVQGGLVIRAALVRREQRRPAPVDLHVYAAEDGRQAASLPLRRELELGLGDLAEVAFETAQLALGVLHEIRRPAAVRAVVQYDLHRPSIRSA